MAATAAFRGIFKPSQTRHPVQQDLFSFHVKDLFTIPQLLLAGALLQILALAVLPTRYALIPTGLLLAHSITTTVMYSISPSTSPFAQGVIRGRVSAQLPNASYDPRSSGEGAASLYGNQAASKGVVVLHLGVRFTHPLGVFAPGGRDIGDLFAACNRDVVARAKDYGCIGVSSWRAGERGSQNSFMYIYYFRNIEGLNAFAHDKIHRDAWTWYNDFGKKHGFNHIGVFHEAFVSKPGTYETIYVNMPPVMMGAANVQARNDQTGEDEWMRPLVDANVPALRSQFGRMGKSTKEGEEANGDLY